MRFGGEGEKERQTPSGGDCSSTSNNGYTTVVECEVLHLENPQQTQDLGTVQNSKSKRLTSETPRTGNIKFHKKCLCSTIFTYCN